MEEILSGDPKLVQVAAAVKLLLSTHGTDILPITLVDSQVCKEREYPTTAKIRFSLVAQKM